MPDKFELFECKTIKDYVEMYKVADSCMSIPAGKRPGSFARRLYDAKGLWSSIFYYYCPELTGYVLKKNGKGVARRFIYKNKYYFSDDVYSEEFMKIVNNGIFSHNVLSSYLKEFHDVVEDKGFRLYKSFEVPISRFKIPAVHFENKIVGPLPYCDCIRKPFWVSYDKRSDSFIYDPKKGTLMVIDPYEYSTWIQFGGISEADEKYNG